MTLEKNKQNRFLFLKLLYDQSGGDTGAMFNMWKVGQEIGFNSEETRRIVDYLTDEYLIEPRALGGGIVLTHDGIKEVEQALENPSKPTQHFLPINVINIGTMNNSAVQQGTIDSNLTFQLGSKRVNELDSILKSLNEIKDKLDLVSELHEELISEIQTLEIQKVSPKPKGVIIQESLKTIRTILVTVASNSLTKFVLEKIDKILN